VPTMDLSHITWRKSSRSTQNGSCVEVGNVPAGGGTSPASVAVRDSKNPGGPVLTVSRADWHAFTSRIKRCEFDLPE
jgi:hypothetical protein